MKTVLLTGSEGYIGKNFQELYRDSYKFICLDKKLDKKVEDFNEFDQHIDYIIHLAGISGLSKCEENLDQTFIDNVSGTIHLMKAAWAFNIPMIFTSSQATKDPKSSLYATTKRIGEVEAERYNKQYGNIKVLRLSNVYGGKYYLKYKDSVISKFVNAKMKKKHLIVHGDGLQTRDLIHVHEVCRCIEMCLNDTPLLEPVDVGTGIERSIKEVAEKISDKITYEEGNVGTSSNVADIDPIKSIMGFEPKDMLDEYLNNVW